MNKEKEEVEIDLLELGKKLWDNKKFIIKCSIIGAIVGLVIAFSIPKEYTTTVQFITSENNVRSNNMGAIASIAGIKLDSEADIISPALYLDIMNSTPFIQNLFEIPVLDEEKQINTTVYNYFKTYQEKPWWGHLIGAVSYLTQRHNNTEHTADSNRKYYISKSDLMIIDAIKNSYSINTENKTGIVTLSVTTQNPIISATLTDTLTHFLQDYIIEQRTSKANQDLENTEKLHIKAQKDYYEAQKALASFVDANINVISARYKVNQERLQNEVSLTYTIYNQMAQQVQVDKMKVQNNTPIFIILQPAIEPIEASKPRKKMIVIVFAFLAITTSSFFIYIKR